MRETSTVDELVDFINARLDEDQRRFENQELPLLDEAERHGHIRIMRTDDEAGLLVSAGPLEAREERIPVPFPEKAHYLRQEGADGRDENVLRLVAAVYDAHPAWREVWRP